MDKTCTPVPVRRGRGGPALPGALLTAAVVLLGAAPAWAQPTLLVTDLPGIPRESKPSVRLRPNVAGQRAYLFVRNPGQDDVTVSVALRSTDGSTEVLRSKPLTVKPDRTEPVVFDGAAPAAATPPAAPAAAGQPPAPPPGIELKGPPFHYEFVLLGADGKPVANSGRPVQLLRPQDYVDPPRVTFDGNTRELRVSVTAKRNFSGPRAPVALVLSPAHVPGLIESPDKAGTYLRHLTGPEKTVDLVARNLQFDKKRTTENGLVFVNVDGYERAFTFKTTFRLEGGDNRADWIDYPVVGVHWKRYEVPSPLCPVRVDVDNAPADSVVEVGLKHDDQEKEYAEDDLKVLRAPRDQRVRVTPSPDGGVTFATEVRDWATDMDSADLFQEHALRVRLLSSKGEELSIVDARDLLRSRVDTTRSIEVPVTFDSSPPEIKSFGVLLTKQEKGKPVDFVATSTTDKADNRTAPGQPLRLVLKASDPESGIQDVLFFLGTKPPDPKAPEAVPTVEGRPEDGKRTTWRAELPAPAVPADKGGTVTVTAQVTNGAGAKSFGTIEIKLVPPPPPAPPGPPPKPSIEGTVVDAAGRAQHPVEVTLTDAQNVVRDTQTTDASGKFVFKNLAPGSYRLSALKSSDRTRGSVAVQVAEGEKKTGVEIKLALR
jgi:hypothetical protein